MNLESLGIIHPKAVYRNLTVPELYEHALVLGLVSDLQV